VGLPPKIDAKGLGWLAFCYVSNKKLKERSKYSAYEVASYLAGGSRVYENKLVSYVRPIARDEIRQPGQKRPVFMVCEYGGRDAEINNLGFSNMTGIYIATALSQPEETDMGSALGWRTSNDNIFNRTLNVNTIGAAVNRLFCMMDADIVDDIIVMMLKNELYGKPGSDT